MKIGNPFFTLTLVSFVALTSLTLGIPIPGFATEPHVCIGTPPNPATSWQNLGSTTQISWGYGAGCNHSSNTIAWKFYLYNYVNNNVICSDDNGGAGYTIPPDTELHTVGCTIPKGATVKLRARVWYQVIGSDWMYSDDFLTNK